MTFRPYPVLSLFTLAALALLVWLGSWQLDRRVWKQDLLADFAATRDAAPATLAEALCEGQAAPGRGFDASGAVVRPAYVRVYGIGPEGGPGWRVFAPVTAPDCAPSAAILAEVRFDPLDTARAGASGVPAGSAPVSQLRFERPLGAGPFTPDSGEDGFYAYAPNAMADALGLARGALSPDWWLARDTGAPPAHLTQTPPERHLAYAITWFAMALALIGVYGAYHMRAGRLTLKRG
ncbi:MAG: SURF1 family protein [Oceanicaulis sp.]